MQAVRLANEAGPFAACDVPTQDVVVGEWPVCRGGGIPSYRNGLAVTILSHTIFCGRVVHSLSTV